ncbi:hypothetical protein B0H10DRAFT_1964118 [Mycena sp. CBHHK59/15]|nr:hypothetical protein B0H10DRAFT_1964118 [Mycena sp. CBHHK59/15]
MALNEDEQQSSRETWREETANAKSGLGDLDGVPLMRRVKERCCPEQGSCLVISTSLFGRASISASLFGRAFVSASLFGPAFISVHHHLLSLLLCKAHVYRALPPFCDAELPCLDPWTWGSHSAPLTQGAKEMAPVITATWWHLLQTRSVLAALRSHT